MLQFSRLLGIIALIMPATAMAAAKYTAPTIPMGDNGIAKFDTGSPTTTWNTGNTTLNIQCSGTYNYDDAWTFKKLEIEIQKVPTAGGATTVEASTTFNSETAVGTPPAFNANFPTVGPPPVGFTYNIVARLTLQKNGTQDIHYIDAKPMALPPIEEP